MKLMLNLPLQVVLPRKTKADYVFRLNLNEFRNAHYQTLDQAKKRYSDIVLFALVQTGKYGKYGFPPEGPFHFQYTYFPGSARDCDLGNVLPIVQKFTEDPLQKFGVIANDNYKVIREVSYNFGGIDRKAPRVELAIETIEGCPCQP